MLSDPQLIIYILGNVSVPAQIYKGIHRNVFYFGGIFKVWVAVGVLAEGHFDAVCCIDVVDSNSRSLASLYFGCFLLSAFEDILSPLAVTHKYIFRSGVSNKIQPSESKETPPPAAQPFAFILPSESQPEVQLSDSSQSLCLFLLCSRSSQVSHLHQQALTQQCYGECDGILDLFCDCTSLKVAQVKRNAAGLLVWVQSLEDNALETCQISSASTHDQIWPGTAWTCQALPRW